MTRDWSSDVCSSDLTARQLDHERRLNALRAELQQAIAAENFEHAAQLDRKSVV